jgi:hypothetical protein
MGGEVIAPRGVDPAGKRPIGGKRRRRRLLWVVAALLLVYPVLVIGYTWSHVLRSDLEGGRNGQLDAYRHALASAVVSHTMGDWAVRVVTSVFERDDGQSNVMDRHNNRVGSSIGSRVAGFGEIEPAVRAAVLGGAVDAADPDRITWLPAAKWRDGRLW